MLNPVEAVVWGSGDAEDTEADVAGCDVLELSINSKPTSEMQPLMGQVGAGFCKPTQEFWYVFLDLYVAHSQQIVSYGAPVLEIFEHKMKFRMTPGAPMLQML